MSRHHHKHHHPAPPHHNLHPIHKAAIAANQSNAEFLAAAIPAAQISEQETGVPASITLAQACIESGWGRHHIGAANNYFGIKASAIHGKPNLGPIAIGYVTVLTHEYNSKGELHEENAPFRQYANMTDSFRDHGQWVQNNSHYPSALAAYAKTGDADTFARALQAGGYAGLYNTVYADALILMMKAHNFYQYNAVRAS